MVHAQCTADALLSQFFWGAQPFAGAGVGGSR